MKKLFLLFIILAILVSCANNSDKLCKKVYFTYTSDFYQMFEDYFDYYDGFREYNPLIFADNNNFVIKCNNGAEGIRHTFLSNISPNELAYKDMFGSFIVIKFSEDKNSLTYLHVDEIDGRVYSSIEFETISVDPIEPEF